MARTSYRTVPRSPSSPLPVQAEAQAEDGETAPSSRHSQGRQIRMAPLENLVRRTKARMLRVANQPKREKPYLRTPIRMASDTTVACEVIRVGKPQIRIRSPRTKIIQPGKN